MLIYECSFQHGIDKSSWEIGFGGFYPSRNHGLMVDTGGTAIIWFRTSLDDVILEFDAESIHGSGVSIALCGPGKGGSFDLGYHIGFGEYDNTKTFIRRLGVTVVENNRELIEHDKKYHVKVQKYGGTIRFYLGERLIFDYVDANPLSGQYHQYIGLGKYGSQFTKIAFDNVKIYSKLR